MLSLPFYLKSVVILRSESLTKLEGWLLHSFSCVACDGLAIGTQLFQGTHVVIVAVGLPDRSRTKTQPMARHRRRALERFQAGISQMNPDPDSRSAHPVDHNHHCSTSPYQINY